MDENVINRNCDANLQKIITMFLVYFRNQVKRKHDLQLEEKNKTRKKEKNFTKAKINKNLNDMTLEVKKQSPPPSPKRKQQCFAMDP